MNTLLQKALVVSMTLGLLTAIVSEKAHADGAQIYGGEGGCIPVYGGGVSCPRPGQVLLDKSVINPATGIYVDNLDIADPKFHPRDTISFRITVRNSGEETLSAVEVTDTLPSFVDFQSGPVGSNYDENTRQLRFTARDIGAGASQIFDIKVRASHIAVLPEGKNIVCPLNVADAVTADQTDHDEAKFCIEKEIEVPEVPKAGPENWLITLFGLGASLKAGLVLRKKTNV